MYRGVVGRFCGLTLIHERLAYRMRTKQLPVAGHGERLTCPAAGAAPTARCDL